MAKYKAIVEVDLNDDENNAEEVAVIEEALFQSVTAILESAGYIVENFKSMVLFEGETE